MSDKRYTKVEEEIIQILNQMDDEPDREAPSNIVKFRPRPRPKREVTRTPRLRTGGITQRVRQYSAGSWVGVGIVVAIVSWQLGRFVPMLGMAGVIVSLGAFMAALYTWRAGSVPGVPTAGSGPKRWRGRDIDFSPRSAPPSMRARKWSDRFRKPKL